MRPRDDIPKTRRAPSMNFYDLPSDILSLVYSMDDTYREAYNACMLQLEDNWVYYAEVECD